MYLYVIDESVQTAQTVKCVSMMTDIGWHLSSYFGRQQFFLKVIMLI